MGSNQSTLSKEDRENIESDYRNIVNYSDPSEEMQLLAIKMNPEAYHLIKNPTTSASWKFIKSDSKNIEHIEDPDQGMIEYAVNVTFLILHMFLVYLMILRLECSTLTRL